MIQHYIQWGSLDGHITVLELFENFQTYHRGYGIKCYKYIYQVNNGVSGEVL